MEVPTHLKLGKAKPTEDNRDLRFASYKTTPTLPDVPQTWGYDNIYPRNGWAMLGNDEYGDCVWAGAAHEHMLMNVVAGHPVTFTAAGVLSDYSACTGFVASDPSSDQGTNVRDALNYRRKTGIIDAKKTRHKIGAYLALDVDQIKRGDFTEVAEAVYLFGQVGLGIEFPQSAMDEFNAGQMWRDVKGSQIEGGHYVPVVAKRHHIEIVSWARVVPCSQPFLEHYVDEAWAIVSSDFLQQSGKTVAGFDLATLNADLGALGA
jgi:hypothetical protein